MKTSPSPAVKWILFAVFFLIMGSIGHPTQAEAQKTTAKEAQEKTAQALQAIGSYSADQRDEAVRKAKETLDDIDTRIDHLGSQVSQNWDQMDQSARTKARQALTALRKQRTEAAEWYGGLKHSSANAWEDVKTGFVKSYQNLQSAFEKAAAKF